MTLTLVAAPAAAAMTLAELGDHVRLPFGFGAAGQSDAGQGSPDDAALTRALDAATTAVERALSTALLRQTWEWRVARWPSDALDPALARLPIAPVLSVDAVETIDADGASTAWETSSWRLDLSSDGPALRALARAPSVGAGGFMVRFQAGYGDQPSDAPADLRHAVALLAAHYFENRHAASDTRLRDVPEGIERLLAPYRRHRL